MSSTAGTALVALALLAGCPASQSVPCDNGVICPEGLVCTENAVTQCGQALEVQACRDDNKVDLTPCSFPTLDQGVCRDNVCIQCTTDLTGCSFPQWVPMTTVASNLHGLWVAGRAHAYAIGDGVALEYDGFTWTHIAELEALFDPVGEQLTSIWGISEPLEIFIAGSRIFHYREGRWSVDLTPALRLSAIGGGSRTNVLAAGILGEIWKYDGTLWSQLDAGAGAPDAFNGVWFAGPNDAFLVGPGPNVTLDPGVVRRLNGTVWSTFYTASDQQELKTIWGTSANDFFIGGVSGGDKPIAHFTGTWESQVVVGISEIRSIWGTTSTDVFAGDVGGVILRSDGGPWTPMQTPGSTILAAIQGASSSDVLAVGETGELWHYSPGN